MFSYMKKYSMGGVLVAMVLVCSVAIAESEYPEPFKSKIIFQDTDYISEHANDNGGEQNSSASPVGEDADEAGVLEEPTEAAGEISDNGIESDKYLLAMIVLALLAGSFFFGSKASNSSTSVSRYIARRNLAGTGVEKYLFYRGY